MVVYTRPGSGRACTTSPLMSTTCATAWLRVLPPDDPSALVHAQRASGSAQQAPRQPRVVRTVQIDRKVDSAGVHRFSRDVDDERGESGLAPGVELSMAAPRAHHGRRIRRERPDSRRSPVRPALREASSLSISSRSAANLAACAGVSLRFGNLSGPVSIAGPSLPNLRVLRLTVAARPDGRLA